MQHVSCDLTDGVQVSASHQFALLVYWYYSAFVTLRTRFDSVMGHQISNAESYGSEGCIPKMIQQKLMRVWYIGSAPGFHPVDKSSILLTRTKFVGTDQPSCLHPATSA